MVIKRHSARRSMISMGLVAGLLAVAGPVFAANTAVAPIPGTSPRWLARHQAEQDQIKAGHADLLWIGDSIVQRFSDDGISAWKKYYKHRNAVNMGISGDRTEHVLWRLDDCDLTASSPKLAIVMIGQNNGGSNTAEEIAEGVTAVTMKLREKRPNMKILLLGIFFRGEKPNDEQIKLAKTNEIISKLADDQHIFYMNVNSIFLDKDGTIKKSLMPDFEHPNKKGCKVWAAAIEPKVAELFGDKPIKP